MTGRLIVTLLLVGCEKTVPVVDPPGEPLRTMTTRPLFGDMPIDNRFLSPELSLIDGFGWLAYSDGAAGASTVVRVYLPNTPLGQPALLLHKASNPTGLGVLGGAKSLPGAVDVSVWAGRKTADAHRGLPLVSARLLGLLGDGSLGAIDLAATGEPLILDEMTWQRFAAHIPAGPIGHVTLDVGDESPADLYISSPVLVAGASPSPLMRGRRARQPTSKERRHLELVEEQWRDRLFK